MADPESTIVFLAKAEGSLAGAESAFANDRFNNCANRSYYACFQAAIGALVRAGIESAGPGWNHGFVQARFAGELVYRRKLYPASLRDALTQNLALRQRADYELQRVSGVQALRALRRARQLMEAIVARENERR